MCVDKEAMKYACALVILAATVIGSLSATGPEFEPVGLSDDDLLLFKVHAEQPGQGASATLMSADLGNGDRLDTLSFFPEHARYFPGAGFLEIRNRFGLYRLTLAEGGSPVLQTYHPAFESGNDIPPGRVLPHSTSPNGRWTILQEPVDKVHGRLVVHDTATGSRLVMSGLTVLDYRRIPVLWSPDSRYLIYERDDLIYYVATRQIENETLPDESYRQFGRGHLESLRWTGHDSLIHLEGRNLTLIRPSEFFTGAFYDDPLPVGSVAGKLPISFDADFDRFWPAPDGRSVLVLSGGRNLFYFPIEDRVSSSNGRSLPYMLLPDRHDVRQLWWKQSGEVLILVGPNEELPGQSYRLYNLDTSAMASSFRLLEPGGIRRLAPSPDRSHLAVVRDTGVEILDPLSFETNATFDHPGAIDVFWKDANTILVTGSRLSELVDTKTGLRRVIALSSIDEAGFGIDGSIITQVGSRRFRLDSNGVWEELANPGDGILAPAGLESPVHRVYTEASHSLYRNLIHVRTVEGFGNRILFDAPIVDAPGSSEVDTDTFFSSENLFNHGSRLYGRQVSLVFNAVEGDEGLRDILEVLADYGIRSTFFVSGDFIRRYPESTRTLAMTDHEIGSLFYTHMDMTDYRYRIDKEFVIRGLGRNEDEFFRTTGREITTLWHPPWYVVSPAILDATREMNYTYVGRDLDPQDWISLDDGPVDANLYRSSAETVARILKDVRPGSILPIRVGVPGERSDYFFTKLDLLINGLLKDGYDIVAVSELMENSQ